MPKLFILVNVDTFFLSHRKEIAIKASQEGYDVTIVANDTGKGDYIRSLGLRFIDLPIDKSGLNIFQELNTFFFIRNLIKQEKPDIVHAVGMKLILWGGLAARICKVKGFVSAISGLGVLFSPEFNKGIKRIISNGVLALMRYIHDSKDTFCIFHNKEDISLFVKNNIIDESRCLRTMGSGIDLDEFKYTEEPTGGKIRVIFTARMVEDKGVLVLIDAANSLREEYEDRAEFLLCGGLETNPLAVSRESLESLCDGRYLQWLGKRNDVRQLLEQSHIFAFPSYYKEGLPKSCIEAAAIGRPIITCNTAGCSDTVIDGETGFLIPKKDSKALAKCLKTLFDAPELRKEMGRKARLYAEKNFSINDVISTHLSIYRKLISTNI